MKLYNSVKGEIRLAGDKRKGDLTGPTGTDGNTRKKSTHDGSKL